MGQTAANSNHDFKSFKTVGQVAASRRPLLLQPEEHVRVVLPALQLNGGAAGVVDDDGDFVGLLTEREVLRRIFALAKDPTIHPANLAKHIEDMTVGEAMQELPETLDEDITAEDALGIMARRGLRFMPVVSRCDRSHLLGVVDERELALVVRHRLEEARQNEAESRSLLSFLLHEPYGAGYTTA